MQKRLNVHLTVRYCQIMLVVKWKRNDILTAPLKCALESIDIKELTKISVLNNAVVELGLAIIICFYSSEDSFHLWLQNASWDAPLKKLCRNIGSALNFPVCGDAYLPRCLFILLADYQKHIQLSVLQVQDPMHR